jgi:hypothetical protein
MHTPAFRAPGAPSAFSRRLGQRGQSMVEYLIILPSLLLLVLGAVQFGLLYQIKSQVNYATFAAARQGALKNGSTTAIKDAFAAGMTPIFTNKPNFEGMVRGRAVGAIEAFNPLVTTIARINPPEGVKDDTNLLIEDPTAAAGSNNWILPNDNLQYRNASTLGSSTGRNIQDLNILKIRVTYCAKMIVPLANVVIYSVVNGIEGVKTVGGQFFAKTDQTATTPNSCAQLKDRFGSVVDKIDDAGSAVGLDLGFIKSALQTVSDKLAVATVPGLNWVIGGYRIPVSSEAVVRMQTPFKVKK